MRAVRVLGLASAAAVSLLAAVVLLTRVLGGGASEKASGTLDEAGRRTRIEATIAATPDIAPFFERLRTLLPARFDAAVGKAVDDPTASPDVWLSEAVKTVRQSHGVLAAKADGDHLSSIFSGQAAVLDALSRRDARLCVDFLYGGASEGFFRFAAENRALVGGLALAGLEAIADGQAKKITREAPTDADFQALEAALRERGLSATEIATLLDGKAPEPPLPDARICEMGRLYLDALASLPQDAKLRLYALAVDLMARS